MVLPALVPFFVRLLAGETVTEMATSTAGFVGGVAVTPKTAAKASVKAPPKTEHAETMIAAKLGLSRPFVMGKQGKAGGIPVRWIPAGRLTMGSPAVEELEGRGSDETQHEVVLSRGFFLAETECTQRQWKAVMGSNPSHFKGSDRPVEQVMWAEAVAYCRKLTAKHRQQGILPKSWEWRLPTESEWEYAARAGTTDPRHGQLDAVAWHYSNAHDQSQRVKTKRANAWGLHDMIGNVSEWCSDWYGYYPAGTVTDPKGPRSAEYGVFRGGSWTIADVLNTRSAHRGWADRLLQDSRLGFRPALSSVR